MDTVERHIGQLRDFINRYDRTVGTASVMFRTGIGAAEKRYERICVAEALRMFDEDRCMSIMRGMKRELALMSLAKGDPKYDAIEKAARDEFDKEMLRLELVRDDAIAAANKAFLLLEEELRKAHDEDGKLQPPREAA